MGPILPIATVNATEKFNKTQKNILSLLRENKYATYDEIAKGNTWGLERCVTMSSVIICMVVPILIYVELIYTIVK